MNARQGAIFFFKDGLFLYLLGMCRQRAFTDQLFWGAESHLLAQGQALIEAGVLKTLLLQFSIGQF